MVFISEMLKKSLKTIVVVIPSPPSLAATPVVVMTTIHSTSDDNIDILAYDDNRRGYHTTPSFTYNRIIVDRIHLYAH